MDYQNTTDETVGVWQKHNIRGLGTYEYPTRRKTY